jgi:serine/threonine protein kinase
VHRQLGRYTLERPLGEGGVGRVWLAQDTFTGQPVAVKVIDNALFADEARGPVKRKLFLNEASLVGKLSHPHIVAILDAAIQEEPHYIVTEYLPGGSLADALRAGERSPLEDAVEIGFKCCSALDYASRFGIVHRDIKPGNILRVSGSEVKLGDFGAAYFRHADDTQISDAGWLSVFRQTIPESQRFRALRGLPTASAFSDAEIWELARAGTWKRVPARSVLVAEGDAGHSVFLLARGEAKVTIQGHLLNVLERGDCFGEMAYVRAGAAPRQVTVEATADVLLVEYDAASLERTSTGCQLRFSNLLLHALSDRLALADTRILQLSR